MLCKNYYHPISYYNPIRVSHYYHWWWGRYFQFCVTQVMSQKNTFEWLLSENNDI